MPTAASTLRNPVNLIWVVLMVTTLGSWWLGADHDGDVRQLATVGVIVLAFAKVQLVGLYFMEVRHASRLLQGLFAAYVAAVGGGLVLLYLLM